ncbi:MAG: hypothetical protein HF978_21065 [Desulfobacteraceae bacterium]|nr:hypothetical protein [Desulfobacteraceae bacterium]MBC2758041.1 hypothetical protein [Desulfobacteraceae bacterium]
MNLRTCVVPSGKFTYGIHKPGFKVINMRENNYVSLLGLFADDTPFENQSNFPPGAVEESNADMIYEIPNPFPFRGVTYIAKRWAEEKAQAPSSIMLPELPDVSFTATIRKWFGKNQLTPEKKDVIFQTLPKPLQLTIAGTSTDPDDLICLSKISCEFIFDKNTHRPCGVRYQKNENGIAQPLIKDKMLYEVIANNLCLPDDYKQVMVLKPGVQGGSEIVGEWSNIGIGGKTHVFEYLRRNSYIPWGHYAANMADDAVRYRVNDLSETDMTALRHLYYQRTFVRMAQALGISTKCERRCMAEEELESLRIQITDALDAPFKRDNLGFNRTLWGWNFGFDYAPSEYRLHASHQQIHQQYAMVPAAVGADHLAADQNHSGNMMAAFACGDLIADFIGQYRQQTGKNFFETYIQAIYNNQRLDGKDNDRSLIIYEDANVMLFVPKAQTSQWEVQLMTLRPVGNILEADLKTRRSLDHAILIAVQILEKMGAKMITVIEYSKSFNIGDDDGQRLLYAFLPRLPESPGAFSEAQLRWINGHYPEDFAAACRMKISNAGGDK